MPSRPKSKEVVEGLEVSLGFVCDHCQSGFTLLSSLRRHHQKLHKNAVYNPGDGTDEIQRLDRFSNTTYFPVDSGKSIYAVFDFDSESHILQLYTDKLKKHDRDVTSDVDIRNVSPWLRTTRWHEHVQGHSTEGLMKLVAPPSVLEIPFLDAAVIQCLLDASETMSSTPELVLQRLISPYPEVE
jgi:hypothetical protein